MGWRETSIKLKCVCVSVALVCHHHYHLWLDSFMKYSVAKDRPEMEGATGVFEWHLIFCTVYIPEDNTEQVLAVFHHKLMTRAIASSFYYGDMLLGIMDQAIHYYYMLMSSYSHWCPQYLYKTLHWFYWCSTTCWGGPGLEVLVFLWSCWRVYVWKDL